MAQEKVDPMAKSRAAVDAALSDTSDRVYRVYCDGIFDLFHLGHMNMLRQAKISLGDPKKVSLLVGVCDDEMTQKYKGKLVMNHKLRCESVEQCKWVDQVVPEAPWVITAEFLEKYKIDFVAHDAVPYTDTSGASDDGGDVYALVKRMGKFLETQRTEGISTSDLIVQIIRDYDEYVMRNLDRGYTKESLNVGKTWELRSIEHEKGKKLKAAVAEAKASYKELSEAIKVFMHRFGPSRSIGDFKYAPADSDDDDTKSDTSTSDRRSRSRSSSPTREVMQSSYSFTKACLSATWLVLEYINPIGYMYCCKKKKKSKKA